MEVPGNEVEGDLEDIKMAGEGGSAEEQSAARMEPANKRFSRNQPGSSLSRETSVEMTSDNDNDSFALSYTTQSGSHDGSSASSTTAVSRTSAPSANRTTAVPPMEEQIATIESLSQVPMQEGMVGYVISNQWLQDAQKHGTGTKKTTSNEAQPPVDSRGLIKPTDSSWQDLLDERGESFVPLKPGLTIGQDIEVLPKEAWDKIMSWHGRMDGSPEIKRYCHNTSTNIGSENFTFELYPPVFTLMKLSDPHTQTSVAARKQQPIKLVATRTEKVPNFIKRAKEAAAVTESVRLWKIIGVLADPSQPGLMTPAQSRSNSPAPASLPVNLANKLIVDTKQFLDLENGTKRELVDLPATGSSLSLDGAGLGQEGILILDPQIGGPAGGEYVSESVASTAHRRLLNEEKSKSSVSSGRTSPAPAGIQTRGRTQRSSKVRGTTGLINMGNTCYMNSALQCVKSVRELTMYFLEDRYKRELNPSNPLAHNGEVAKEYAKLLKQMFADGAASFSPRQFKATIGKYGASFSGYGQQDSQEFLLFLLDGLQEDLNRIHKKPYIEKPDSTDEMVHDEAALRQFAGRCWEIYKARNDSVITDLFAGMYKSTVTCPVCDKVSIIFDPYNNLTLQLPIENVWSRTVIFHPLNCSAIEIEIDIDKNSTFGQVKEFIGARTHVDPRRIVLTEIYHCKFYRVFNNDTAINEERIQPEDLIVAFELDEIPSNYPDPRPRKAVTNFYHASQDDDFTEDEVASMSKQLLVPIFHRQPSDSNSTRNNKNWKPFGYPSYITVSEEEAKDYDAILKKVLARVMIMTSRDILDVAQDSEEDDAVIMNAEDTDSSDSRIKAQSIQGEEGIVDVKMRDPEDDLLPRKSYPPMPRIKRALPSVLEPDRPLDDALTRMFTMKTFDGEGLVPTGWTRLADSFVATPMTNRIPRSPKHRASTTPMRTMGEKLKRQIQNGGSDTESSDDELRSLPPPVSAAAPDSSDDERLPPVEELNAPKVDRFGNDIHPAPEYPTEPVPLVRLGEGVICDWDPAIVDSLFHEVEAKEKNVEDDLRGRPTWNNPRPLLPDPALDRKRDLRKSRKRNGISLEDCLDEFGKEEILSANDAWYCPRCKEHRRASKNFELWKVPDILVIHLKRFSVQGRLRDKLDVNVEFPIEGLDLSHRVADNEGKEMLYDLFAVDNHYGGLGGGHYTAYAKNFNDGCWYDYNDASAYKQSDPDRLGSSAAYLLFYRRRSQKPLGGPFFEHMLSNSPSPSPSSSRATSPAGEGQRLDGSFPNGSSSVSQGVGVARPPAGGGRSMERGNRRILDDDDDLPHYSETDPQSVFSDPISESSRSIYPADLPMESMEVDDGAERPSALFGGPIVTWKGFAPLKRAEDDGENSSTGAIDDERSRGSENEWIRPGTPEDSEMPPSIKINEPEEHPVAEVRLDSDETKE